MLDDRGQYLPELRTLQSGQDTLPQHDHVDVLAGPAEDQVQGCDSALVSDQGPGGCVAGLAHDRPQDPGQTFTAETVFLGQFSQGGSHGRCACGGGVHGVGPLPQNNVFFAFPAREID
ncbi:hypothetical protein [Cryobacterium cryoconiti]|uniref:Uncharacterized protein n=1 Tax=Cryobacterium cryoconiti TaxID=1259239 RepID=A0A4Y8JRM6_9MICO|nr:hypothetical protein [Cryobacterium cryoconiti]TFD26999.1 hypothetical protein E3T49_14020 [Cryobacterium cryoconiti]